MGGNSLQQRTVGSTRTQGKNGGRTGGTQQSHRASGGQEGRWTWGPVITAAATMDQSIPSLCGGSGVLESVLAGHEQRGDLKPVPSPSKFRVVSHKNRDSVSCNVDEPRDESQSAKEAGDKGQRHPKCP